MRNTRLNRSDVAKSSRRTIRVVAGFLLMTLAGALLFGIGLLVAWLAWTGGEVPDIDIVEVIAIVAVAGGWCPALALTAVAVRGGRAG